MSIDDRLAIYGPALCVCGRRLPDRHTLTCRHHGGGKHEAPVSLNDMENMLDRRLVAGPV